MKKNFDELFSKMSPEAQERAKARASELLRDMDLVDSTQPSSLEQTEEDLDAEPCFSPRPRVSA